MRSPAQKIQETISEIIQDLDRPDLRVKDLAEIRFKIDLLEYLLTPQRGYREEQKAEVLRQSCCVPDCGETFPASLWNVARFGQEDRWVCLRHIPPDLTFPIGLWGQEWQESGRKVPRDPRDGGGEK